MGQGPCMKRLVVLLSLGLYFFVVPHVLEDFLLGVPEENSTGHLPLS